MPNEKRTKDTITLGSGYLYMLPYASEMPDIGTICTSANRVGYIKGGASLEYTQETYEEKDDFGIVHKIITTSEDAVLKAGLLTWNGATFQKLIDRCSVSLAGGMRITKIGGKGNEQGGYFAICFHHPDATDGDVFVMLVGRNTAGLTITYSMDAGSVIEPEFKAMPHDDAGTLIEYVEDTNTIPRILGAELNKDSVSSSASTTVKAQNPLYSSAPSPAATLAFLWQICAAGSTTWTDLTSSYTGYNTDTLTTKTTDAGKSYRCKITASGSAQGTVYTPSCLVEEA